MSDQVQCPNCGGFRTRTISKDSIYAPGKTRPPTLGVKLGRIGCILFTALVSSYIALGIFLTLTLGRYIGPTSEEGMRVFSVIMFGIPLTVALLVGVAMWRRVMPSPMRVQGPFIGTMYNYECYLCGYKWSWRTGTPKPQVHLRPDLIAAGNQRLEEERRRQAEQAEAAAAAWWLQQQQKKK